MSSSKQQVIRLELTLHYDCRQNQSVSLNVLRNHVSNGVDITAVIALRDVRDDAYTTVRQPAQMCEREEGSTRQINEREVRDIRTRQVKADHVVRELELSF